MYGKFGVTTFSNGSVTRAAQTALFVIGLTIVGTGSVSNAHAPDRLQTYFKPKADQKFSASEKQVIKPAGIDLRSPVQHMENIKKVFTIPVSELAASFGVTRQSIYKWLAGTANPEEDKLAKIAELSKLADAFQEAAVDKPTELIKMKAFNGRSMLDMFKNNETYAQLIPVLIKESRAMDKAYDASGLASLQNARTDDWKSSVSTPYADEV